MVKPYNALMDARTSKAEDERPEPEIVVLEEIRDLLKAERR